MTNDERTVQERLNTIKKALYRYFNAIKKSNTDTDLLKAEINKLFNGDGAGIVSINQLIINSIKSRPEKKTDRENLQSDKGEEFKVVVWFINLTGIKKFKNIDPFLDEKLEALKGYSVSYTKEMKKFYADKAVSFGKISQDMGKMPKVNNISGNGKPVADQTPNADKVVSFGKISQDMGKMPKDNNISGNGKPVADKTPYKDLTSMCHCISRVGCTHYNNYNRR